MSKEALEEMKAKKTIVITEIDNGYLLQIDDVKRRHFAFFDSEKLIQKVKEVL